MLFFSWIEDFEMKPNWFYIKVNTHDLLMESKKYRYKMFKAILSIEWLIQVNCLGLKDPLILLTITNLVNVFKLSKWYDHKMQLKWSSSVG